MQSFFSGCAESLEKHRLEQAGSVVFKRVFFSISENRQPVILKEPASNILLRRNLTKQLRRIS